jgi:peroxiredoxin family protein
VPGSRNPEDMARKRIVILGAGTGGTMTANRLRRRFGDDEAVELVADSGARLYACRATVDMFGLTMDDFVPQVEEIISVGEFYEKAAGGQIIVT